MKKADLKDQETGEAAQLTGAARLVMTLLQEKDPCLKEHGERVANGCAAFIEANNLLREEDLLNVYTAALLHDTGRHFTAAAGPTPAEAPDPADESHPAEGVRVLSVFPGFQAILPAVMHHHEHFDGSGYPEGLRGDAIPLEARVIRLFDAYDRLTAGAEPGRGLSPEEALAEMAGRAGKEFDPDLASKCLSFLKSNPGPAPDFLAAKEAASARKVFTDVMQQFVSGKITPPAMPRVVQQVRTAIKRVDTSVKDIGGIIEKDPVISLRLISVAKSPVYKGYGDVKSVQAAIPRLGLKETLSIVVTIASKSLYEARRPEHRALMGRMWAHSLACAYAAKLIGQGLFIDDPETLYLLGLVHDVGKVVLLRAFADTAPERNIQPDVIVAAIQDAHQNVGRALVKRWGFGEEYGKVIALHEADDFSADAPKEVLVVHLANRITRRLGLSLFKWAGGEPAELPSARILGASADLLLRVEEKVQETVKELENLF
jgi:HD-GYP domain-containing protein (c-di-GMP phosphodiesterase class II)